MRFLGFDISLNHGALVVLDDRSGTFDVDWRYLTTTKKWTDRDRRRSWPLQPLHEDKSVMQVQRLAKIHSYLYDYIYAAYDYDTTDVYAAVEDYAFSKSNGAHQLGEVGGAVRSELWNADIPFRLHDPPSVKKFATGSGVAKKDEMVAAVKKLWPALEDLDVDETTREDLADAFTLAQMARVEYLVRSGTLTLARLTDDERHIFLRTTKSNPVNLLDRPWIRNS